MSIPRIELAISLTILLVSSIAAVYSYAVVTHQRHSSSVLVPQLPGATTQYALFHEDQCVGSYTHSLFIADNNYELRGTGNLRAVWNGASLEPLFKLEATFNSLGQLGVSLVRLSIGADQFSVGTSEINPITTRVRSIIQGAPFTHTFQIPGPIELRRISDHSYRIEYPRMSEILPNSSRLAAAPISRLGTVSMRQVDELPPECLDSSRALDLNKIADRARELAARYGQMLPSTFWNSEQR